MNLTELQAALDKAGVPRACYSFISDGAGDRFRIATGRDEHGDCWEVYYTDRGHRSDPRVFRSESEACEELLRRLVPDPSTRTLESILRRTSTPNPPQPGSLDAILREMYGVDGGNGEVKNI